MATSDPRAVADESPYTDNDVTYPIIHVNSPTNSKMLRSPSRESVATELSLYSVSSLNSDCLKIPSNVRFGFGGLKAVPESRLYSPTQQQQLSCLTPNRGPSPIPGSCRNRYLKVPTNVSVSGSLVANSLIPEVWLEEETDLNLIKSCAALSSALGLQKSFSTGDIVTYVDSYGDGLREGNYPRGGNIRATISELALGTGASHVQYEATRLGMGSRSCSTWVAVGDGVAMSLSHTISSQLPSPQGRPTSVHVENASNPTDSIPNSGVSFTAADLIRSVNKRVRQHYIRRRLLTTYKALERLSQSQFNLDQIAAIAITGDTEGSTPEESKTQSSYVHSSWFKNALTINDVEREQGRPLSKYERNMMIFNWLHTLEETQPETV